VTGGAGFIGANFILEWLGNDLPAIVNIDKLTYAGNIDNLATVAEHADYTFVHGDIADGELVSQILNQHRPSAVVNFAAESHVDRSIHGASEFIQTNVVGTLNLLEKTREYWLGLDAN
ncbi:MAG TPA: dTDP-glucose 4,6-dehydratase, partial [Porticoccaceae bacterium]|nr:dTDP-glucose 4,6-dehydratase [Porticoccaceae bacterium]